MIKRLLGLVFALLITLAPVASAKASLSNDPVSLARWAGCNAKVFTSDQHSPLESFYASGENAVLAIGTEPGVPEAVVMAIVLHEIGHCLQDQTIPEFELAYMIDPVRFELDADMRSADLACRRGYDGIRMMRETMDWAHDVYGYNGDSYHGTLQQRKDAGASAPACQAKSIQS